VLHHRVFVLMVALAFLAVSSGLLLVIGRDFFPTVDVGLMKLHVRAPVGLRLEETERIVAGVEAEIRRLVPEAELQSVNSNIGVASAFNMAFMPSDNVTSQDADIFVSLAREHRPTAEYMRRMRSALPKAFPGTSFYFQPADMVGQVLNFGVAAPIDVQIEGPNLTSNAALAQRLKSDLQGVPGAVDVRVKQVVDGPAFRVNVGFANEVRVARPELSALEAALEAGKVRLRPVLMTALAMIIGMVPMALALGEAGSQNAPLGRAVIGGLLMATFVTLFIVPVFYSLLGKKPPTAHLLESKFQEEQQGSEA
jgi:multidrug efflux pump subunit AcrB